MVTELSLLIARLKRCPTDLPKALGFVTDHGRFIDVLERIDSLVGLEMTKTQIAQQIKTFIVNCRKTGSPTNKEMMHTLIYGPPGCGKTELGQLLAEFWSLSGCLSTDEETTSKSRTIDTEKIALRQRMAIKDSIIKQEQERLKVINTKVVQTVTALNNLRKRVKSKNEAEELRIQAKFQSVKASLKSIIQDQLQVTSSIVPVMIPRIAGKRSEFGTTVTTNEHPCKFIRVTRGDLVGRYQGHTTEKVRELFSKYVGGVIMIDEAYNLLTGKHDDFGKELLTEIINYMTTHPDKTIFIFAGYRKEMEETVLKFQPGLARRFNWTFEIEEYTPPQLLEIFRQQIERGFDSTPIIQKEVLDSTELLFKENRSKFPFSGGDTERLCTYLKETIISRSWEEALDDTKEFPIDSFEVTQSDVEEAYKKYLNNSSKERESQEKDREEKESFDKVKHMYQ